MTESPLYLGLDIGTSGLKAVLTDESGAVRYEANATYPISHPQPLWSEQDPEHWWSACLEALRSLKAEGAHLEDIAGIGAAGQMHGAVLLDAHGHVLRPAILWNDGRSYRECDEMERRVPDLRRRSGNLCMPGFTAPKLIWLQAHEPDIFARVSRVLLPKDYIVYRLTGEFSSEPSDAAGTVWLNPATRDWDDALLSATGLDRSHVPPLHEGCDVVGHVTDAAARQLGLPAAPVVAGGGDNAAGAVGAGMVNAGQGFVSLGTSGVVFIASDRHAALPERTVHAFCHCLPDRWHQMAVTLSAADSLRWLASVTDSDAGDLASRVEADDAPRNDLLFLPYLSGERTPHNDPRAVGMFHGLRSDSTLEDMAVAVMEGVTFSFVDGLDALRAAGSDASALSLIGGGARSAFWRQLCADALGVPLDYRAGGTAGPAFGAARLARIGTAPDGQEAAIGAVCTMPELVHRHEPDTGRNDYLQSKLVRYRQLYDLTRSLHGA